MRCDSEKKLLCAKFETKYFFFKSKGFVKHKQVKISDKKEQRFGDIVTPFKQNYLRDIAFVIM